MTVGITVACHDGVVMGADRKVVMSRGTSIKSLEDKIERLQFHNRNPLLICSAGGKDLAHRAIDRIDPAGLTGDVDADTYRDIVERAIAALENSLRSRGLIYDATLLFAMIDLNGEAVIGHITPSGLTETKRTGYFTAGIAAPYAELVLRDSYSPGLDVDDARLIVAGLIQKIGQVDNDVEGLDVLTMLGSTKEVREITWAERQAVDLAPLSFDFSEELDEIKAEVAHWQAFEEEMKRRREEENTTTPASPSAQDNNAP